MKKFIFIPLMLLCTFCYASDFTNELSDKIFGDISVVDFISYLLFAYAGMIANISWEVFDRTNKAPLDFKYWWKDNKWKVLFSTLLMPVIVILSHELFSQQITNLTSFFIGGGWDKIGEILREKNFITNKNKKSVLLPKKTE